ncbi:MAG: molybdate ABC transporter substrate-binding protein [Gammaproteobacteria bacterium]|nr:molybdate ABC transporter substrate-binding protein [Gammaproteobacteria bacterium]
MLAGRRFLSALLVLSLALPAGAGETRPPLLVFAAASLTDVLQELGPAWQQQSGRAVKFSFAASSALARQVESGGRADVFVSADTDWMDYLQARNLIDTATRVNLLGNRLVLIAPAGSTLQLKIAPGFPLAGALGGGRLSSGDPDSVPVGKYAKSALTSLGVWNSVADRLVRADSVRTALLFVERGEAPLGIVYATDAAIDPRVRVVGTFPAATHLPIVYPAARLAGGDAAATAFITFLHTPAARSVFERYGFVVLP